MKNSSNRLNGYSKLKMMKGERKINHSRCFWLLLVLSLQVQSCLLNATDSRNLLSVPLPPSALIKSPNKCTLAEVICHTR